PVHPRPPYWSLSASRAEKHQAIYCLSDSAVRVAFFDPNNSDSAGIVALQELISCAYIQLRLLRDRVRIRGGMASGDMFSEGTKLFGPAFIEAYDLEH